ncbi:cytochrome P450 family protein [Ceratobasidium sp. AG-Ba]|nr:cytochrome P450 family protein [Ceratobasidium sp. AG-Ba]
MLSNHNFLISDEYQRIFANVITEGLSSSLVSATVVVGAVTIGIIGLKSLSSPYQNINGPRSDSFIYGHLYRMFGPAAVTFHDYLHDTYGSVVKLKGTFGKDELYITDPKAMQEILVKEYDPVFRHPQFQYDFFGVTFGPGLATATGATHKAQRKMLNPVFSSKHMKTSYDAAHWFTFIDRYLYSMLNETLTNHLGETGSKEVDVLYWCNSAALEFIGQAGLGHTFGRFQGIESAYSRAIKDFLPTFGEVAPFRAIFNIAYNYIPSVSLRRKLVDFVPIQSVQRMKEIVRVQDDQARVILNQKKKDLQVDSGTERNEDILTTLLKTNAQLVDNERLPEDQVLGQINALIFAGHETTSGTLTRILDLLSQNLELQNKLRAEISAISATADYDEVNSLPLLDAVCRETLRLYPPVPVLERQPTKDWVVPLRYPVKGRDGTPLCEIVVKKGTHIYLALREANRCKETWGEDADIFRPERWLDPKSQSFGDNKTPGVYSSIMTFGAGPRACLGFRFALLELKVVLSTLLRSFEFTPSAFETEWRFKVGMAPFVIDSGDCEEKAQLPLRVTLVA